MLLDSVSQSWGHVPPRQYASLICQCQFHPLLAPCKENFLGLPLILGIKKMVQNQRIE